MEFPSCLICLVVCKANAGSLYLLVTKRANHAGL